MNNLEERRTKDGFQTKIILTKNWGLNFIGFQMYRTRYRYNLTDKSKLRVISAASIT